jgi:hypothetical protein
LDGDSSELTVSATTPNASFRSRFLAKFRAGLQAEARARQQLAESTTSTASSFRPGVDPNSPDWARQAAEYDRAERRAQERFVEEAYDQAVAPFQHSKPSSSSMKSKNPNKYQFVGVINPSSSQASSKLPAITWYTRPKPKQAKWTVRLVHVNRAAILKDLYDQGKIDVYARYETRQPSQSSVIGTNDQDSGSALATPKVASSYLVRERSWK